ncbi:MAG: molybdopterin molybdotransferase MoeA [Planctomycetota bacterium]
MHEPTPSTNLSPQDAVALLAERVAPIEPETLRLTATSDAAGRVLAAPVTLDRDSPACDVSAMDGFAVRMAELAAGPMPIAGECRIGEAPPELTPGVALRIYTGSPIPQGADTVVPLEQVDERDDSIRLNDTAKTRPGGSIRRRGENAKVGDVVLNAGRVLTPAGMTALASIGPAEITAHRRLRVAIITTGDELETAWAAESHTEPHTEPGAAGLAPWRLRDSNGPTLEALLGAPPWIDRVERTHSADDLDGLTRVIADRLATADAMVLTGGVSKGAYDFVPEAVARAGGERLFHRINARPGRPTFAAVAGGKPILGLPGNPVAVLTAGVRLLGAALRRRAGLAAVAAPTASVELDAWRGKTVALTWWRPATLDDGGRATLVDLRGSGDTCSAAMSDGFIECPPGSDAGGVYPFYPWAI